MKYQSNLRFQSKYDPDVHFTLRKLSHGRRVEFDIATSDFRNQVRDLQREHDKLSQQLDYERTAFEAEQDARLATLKAEDTPEAKDEIRHIEEGRELERLRTNYANSETAEERSAIVEQMLKLDTDHAILFKPDAEIVEQMQQLNRQSRRLLATTYNPARVRWGMKSIEGLEIDDQPATVETLINDGPEELFNEILTKIDSLAALSAAETKNSPSPSTSNESVDGKANDTTAPSASNPDSTSPETAASTSLAA